MNNISGETRKARLTLSLLLMVFLVPIIGASIMYFGRIGIPLHTINKGTLLQPPVDVTTLPLIDATTGIPLSPTAFAGRWVLLMVSPIPCTSECTDTLYKLHQVHTALGKDRDRLVRGFIAVTTTSTVTPQSPGTRLLLLQPQTLTHFFKPLPTTLQPLNQARLYLVDPHGNMMMSYPIDIPFKALLKDLTHVLRVSHIG